MIKSLGIPTQGATRGAKRINWRMATTYQNSNNFLLIITFFILFIPFLASAQKVKFKIFMLYVFSINIYTNIYLFIYAIFFYFLFFKKKPLDIILFIQIQVII